MKKLDLLINSYIFDNLIFSKSMFLNALKLNDILANYNKLIISVNY